MAAVVRVPLLHLRVEMTPACGAAQHALKNVLAPSIHPSCDTSCEYVLNTIEQGLGYQWHVLADMRFTAHHDQPVVEGSAQEFADGVEGERLSALGTNTPLIEREAQ